MSIDFLWVVYGACIYKSNFRLLREERGLIMPSQFASLKVQTQTYSSNWYGASVDNSSYMYYEGRIYISKSVDKFFCR